MPDFIRNTGNITNQTASAGTAIMACVPPSENLRLKTRIMGMAYISAGTAHTLTVMKALAKTSTTAAAAAGATSIAVASTSFGAAQTLAASDFAVIRLQVATGYIYQLLAVSGVSTLTLTVTALETAAPSGSPVWLFGTAAESNAGLDVYLPTVSAKTQYNFGDGGVSTSGFKVEVSNVVYQRSGRGDPLIVNSTNGTAAGTIESISYAHVAA